MISLAIIIGIMGILLFLVILATYYKLLKNNESGFLHLRTTPFLAKFKLNTLIINLETVSWFLFIIIFLVIT